MSLSSNTHGALLHSPYSEEFHQEDATRVCYAKAKRVQVVGGSDVRMLEVSLFTSWVGVGGGNNERKNANCKLLHNPVTVDSNW